MVLSVIYVASIVELMKNLIWFSITIRSPLGAMLLGIYEDPASWQLCAPSGGILLHQGISLRKWCSIRVRISVEVCSLPLNSMGGFVWY